MNGFKCFTVFCVMVSTLLANTALDISQLPSSATQKRLAEIVGYTPHSSVVFENPASLQNIQHTSISAFTSYMMQGESKLDSISAHMPMGIGSFAIGYKSHRVDGLIKTEELVQYAHMSPYPENSGPRYPIQLNIFNYQDSLLKFAYAMSIKNVNLGLNISHFKYKMDSVTGKANNIDLGVFIKNKKTQMSIVFNNAIRDLAKMTYTNSENTDLADINYTLPQRLVYSLNYNFEKFSIFTQLQTRLLSNKYSQYTFTKAQPSLAIQIPILQYPKIVLSGGVNIQDLHLSESKRYNIGLGVETKNFGCDIAYEKTDYKLNPNQLFFSIYLKNIQNEIFKSKINKGEALYFLNKQKIKLTEQKQHKKIILSQKHWAYDDYLSLQSYDVLPANFFESHPSEDLLLNHAMQLLYISSIAKNHQQIADISYFIKGHQSNYTVLSQIKSDKHKVVKLLESNQIKKMGLNQIEWNQLNDQNVFVGEGKYYLEIKLKNQKFNQTHTYTLPIEIVRKKDDINKEIARFYKNIRKNEISKLKEINKMYRSTYISMIVAQLTEELDLNSLDYENIILKYEDCKNLNEDMKDKFKIYQSYLDPHKQESKLRPNEFISNAEAATILNRYLTTIKQHSNRLNNSLN